MLFRSVAQCKRVPLRSFFLLLVLRSRMRNVQVVAGFAVTVVIVIGVIALALLLCWHLCYL
jgi:hypothetical protein